MEWFAGDSVSVRLALTWNAKTPNSRVVHIAVIEGTNLLATCGLRIPRVRARVQPFGPLPRMLRRCRRCGGPSVIIGGRRG